MIRRRTLLAGTTAALAMPSIARAADAVLKVGVFVPLSGAAASWGLGAKWVGEQAAAEINAKGGIKAGGKTYSVEVIAYENGYNSAEGGKAAQAMLNRDGVRFIIQGIGTAPVKALQSLSERTGALLMQVAEPARGRLVQGQLDGIGGSLAGAPLQQVENRGQRLAGRLANGDAGERGGLGI